jgi:hypothetical protein
VQRCQLRMRKPELQGRRQALVLHQPAYGVVPAHQRLTRQHPVPRLHGDAGGHLEAQRDGGGEAAEELLRGVRLPCENQRNKALRGVQSYAYILCTFILSLIVTLPSLIKEDKKCINHV